MLLEYNVNCSGIFCVFQVWKFVNTTKL